MKENPENTPNFGRRDPGADHEGTDPIFQSAKGRGVSNGSLPANGAIGQQSKPAFNPWLLVDLLVQRWYWILLGGLACGAALFYFGSSLVQPKFTATAQLLRADNADANSTYKLPTLTGETFSGLIKSFDLLRPIGAKSNPPLPPEIMVRYIKIDPEPDSAFIKISLAHRDPDQAINLLNDYIESAVAYTLEMQREQARKVSREYLKQQVTQIEKDITDLTSRFSGMGVPGVVTNKLNEIGTGINSLGKNMSASRPSNMLIQKQNEHLEVAIGELNDLLLKYKETYPLVLQKEEEVAALKKRLAESQTNGVASGSQSPAYTVPETNNRDPKAFDPETDLIRMKLLSLEQGRVQLVTRQREAEAYVANPPGMVTIHARASKGTLQSNHRRMKITAMGVFGCLLGLAGSMLLVCLVEFADNRLKTADDVQRVTKLPVLTSLGDLKNMKPHDRTQWAFRTWTLLQGKLSPSANHGLVCGVTSSSEGEGRSTWIKLLAEAASMAGFRVLTISTRPTDGRNGDKEAKPKEQLSAGDLDLDKDIEEHPHVDPHDPTTAVAQNVLTSPSQVTDKLTGPNSQPVVHIPLPGWVWNLERRKQWREALNHWRKIDNLVILVELPPASVSEAVLLGSNLPNLLWLSESGTASAAETREQLETLRNARCNLVGAVMNRETKVSLKKRFPRWLECAVLLAALSAASARAITTEPGAADTNVSSVVSEPVAVPPLNTNTSFSVVNPSQRAEWQKHLTVGPGDLLNFGLFGQPELARTDVVIGPDGRVSYLEATDVLASGLTIDELKKKFDEELGKIRRAPRTIITPVAFRSKRYYMLGKVMTKGVYVLDRPITVLEAIARAHGLENGLIERNVVDLADFQRTFLMRHGKRIPINFEKLFQQGDLSQNIAIEPDDYIYFPSTSVKEVYVVGEVRLPGPVSFRPDMGIIAAISARRGYSDRAYKARVLVVRGSINNPEAIPVDTHAILTGNGLDFRLKPKDIIYVNSRPFIKLEELADLAATAFIQSLVTSWVGVDIVKPTSGGSSGKTGGTTP